jgi:hypothetical protein
MPISSTLRRNRLIVLVAALAFAVVVCGYTSHDLASHSTQSSHCDWTMHFTGVAGSAPQPVPLVKAVLAGWRLPPVAQAALRSARRERGHLARGPPPRLSSG